jgi:hypothetical protein
MLAHYKKYPIIKVMDKKNSPNNYLILGAKNDIKSITPYTLMALFENQGRGIT